MNDAWSVLNLNPSASDEAIRRRYLQLVREFSPERAPERFAEIRKAYDDLRDPIERVRTKLFMEDGREDLDGLIDEFRQQASDVRIPTSTLLNLANAV
ncbi:MAG: J domain-containing protein [Planctomycetaceae bacterium]